MTSTGPQDPDLVLDLPRCGQQPGAAVLRLQLLRVLPLQRRHPQGLRRRPIRELRRQGYHSIALLSNLEDDSLVMENNFLLVHLLSIISLWLHQTECKASGLRRQVVIRTDILITYKSSVSNNQELFNY